MEAEVPSAAWTCPCCEYPLVNRDCTLDIWYCDCCDYEWGGWEIARAPSTFHQETYKEGAFSRALRLETEAARKDILRQLTQPLTNQQAAEKYGPYTWYANSPLTWKNF